MVRFAVHRLKGSKRLVVDLQYPGLETGSTALVAPLYTAENKLEMEIVTPRVTIAGSEFLVAVHLLAAVSRSELGPVEASLAEHEYAIANAINRLFFGI